MNEPIPLAMKKKSTMLQHDRYDLLNVNGSCFIISILLLYEQVRNIYQLSSKHYLHPTGLQPYQ